MLLLLALSLLLNIIALCIVAKEAYYKIAFSEEEEEPIVFHVVIKKHQNSIGNKNRAIALLKSYRGVKEYRELLSSYGDYANVDYKEALSALDKILRKYEVVAKDFLKSDWYSRGGYKAVSQMERLEGEVSRIASLTHTTTERLRELLEERATTTHDNTQAIKIHKENLAKCEKVRPYNHKAVPLKELSTSLIDMLNNLNGKEGMEKNREEILNQLEEVSMVLDHSIEELPTFDSNKYVSNKLSVNKNFLEELKRTDYEDVLKIK